MLGTSWIALFQRIPTDLHDSLAVTLTTGAEILMQSILQLESDFAILRGRMSGSTDAGRVIVLPYDQIVNVAFTKVMLEPEVQAIFGKPLEPSTVPVARMIAEAPVAELAEEFVEAPDHSPPSEVMRTISNGPLHSPNGPAKNQAQAPSKSILLARLRARLAEQSK